VEDFAETVAWLKLVYKSPYCIVKKFLVWKWWESNPRTEGAERNLYKLSFGKPKQMDSLISEFRDESNLGIPTPQI